MQITKVSVNHIEENYFNDYEEIRSDVMVTPTVEKVCKAIDKLNRRYKRHGRCDVLFVTYDDGTGYRLMYDWDPKTFTSTEVPMQLRLRHFVNMAYLSWNTDERVTVAQAKRKMVEQDSMDEWYPQYRKEIEEG